CHRQRPPPPHENDSHENENHCQHEDMPISGSGSGWPPDGRYWHLSEAAEGEPAASPTAVGPCPSRECRSMGDARDGDRPPLARVHDLRPRAARKAASPRRPDDSAGTRVPSLRLMGTEVRELDGRDVADFDAVDAFVARHGLDLNVAAE